MVKRCLDYRHCGKYRAADSLHEAKLKTSMDTDSEGLASTRTIRRTFSTVSRLKVCSPHLAHFVAGIPVD